MVRKVEYKLLIVDDDHSIQELLKETFESLEFDVFCASNANEAMALAEQEGILGFFLDIKLPGMSGIDLLHNLKKHSPAGFFFAITGYASVADLLYCREAGFDDYFSKPFRLEDIIHATREGFGRVSRWQKELEVLPPEYN